MAQGCLDCHNKEHQIDQLLSLYPQLSCGGLEHKTKLLAGFEEAVIHGESEAEEEHVFDVVGFAFFGVEDAVVSNGEKPAFPAPDARNDIVIALLHARGLVISAS